MNHISKFLAHLFFPGNKDPMSSSVQHLDRRTGSDLNDSLDYIDFVLLTPAVPGTQAIKVVLVNHGRKRTLDEDSVSQWRDWATAKGISVLLHNYPGYGDTSGPATVSNIMRDQHLLVSFLIDFRGYEVQQIAVLGNSIGCGPTMAIAELYDFGKVVLVSPYMSCCSLRGDGAGLLQRAAARCVRGSRFDFFAVRKLKNLEHLRGMETLIVCGEEDDTINPINSLEICTFLGSNARLCVLPGVDHRLARLGGDPLIGLFLRGQDEELKAAMGSPETEALENQYSD